MGIFILLLVQSKYQLTTGIIRGQNGDLPVQFQKMCINRRRHVIRISEDPQVKDDEQRLWLMFQFSVISGELANVKCEQ